MKCPDRKTLFTVLSASALLIAGCGGGGGGSPSNKEDDTTTAGELEITQSNGKTVARDTAVGASSIGQSTAQQTQSQIVGGADIDGGASGMSVVEATEFAILRAQDQASSGRNSVTGITESYSCDPGSGSITEDGDGDGVLGLGESWTATWQDCSLSSSGGGTSFSFFLDGEVAFSVTTCEDCDNANDDSVPWEYGFEIDYRQWLIQASLTGKETVDVLFDGTLVLGAVNSTAEGTTTFSVSGGPFSIEDRLNGNDYTYSAIDIDHEVNTTTTPAEYTTVVNDVTLTGTDLGGEVTASTEPGKPFMGDGAYPTSGTLVINGANNSSAIVYAGAPECSDSEFGLVINGGTQTCEPWDEGV